MIIDFILPNDIDDPTRPSGGNRYDRRVIDGLRQRGSTVVEHAVAGPWPTPDGASTRALRRAMASTTGIVVVDGLIASGAPTVIEAHPVVVLLHLPLETADEARALAAARAVITTSQWCRERVLELYPLQPDAVHVATPGVDPAPVTRASPRGERLLCVGAVAPHKGQDLLVAALRAVAELDWSLTCAGPLDRDRGLADAGHDPRISFTGALPPAEVPYDRADLLVAPSRQESYGMAVTEALARGVPVLATAVGGLPEAVGAGGLLVPGDDAAALARGLRGWLTDPMVRDSLRVAASGRRATLTEWRATVETVARVLDGLTAS